MVHKAHIIIAAVVLLTLFAMSAAAQPTTAAATAQSPAAPSFDINAAVDRYLAKMPPAQRARSNAYFEGGYWLLLWDFLCTIIVMWLLLRFRWSARMRNLAERVSRFRPIHTALYWIQFILVVSVLTSRSPSTKATFASTSTVFSTSLSVPGCE